MASLVITSSKAPLLATPETKILFGCAPEQLLYTYDLERPALDPSQCLKIPRLYLDSMHVREEVFVRGLDTVPLRHHMDRDDPRSCFWILYECPSPEKMIPVGTIRLVPYPHYPHPAPGAEFTVPGDDVPGVSAETLFSAPLAKHAVDRATALHDGVEPFVKLGRLSVVEGYRGKRYADKLIQVALEWARTHPDFSVSNEMPGAGHEIPKWKGLVCIHAHVKAIGVWKRNGFVLDEGMGSWFESSMEVVGMFYRLQLD